jgi:hypothetical protein
MYELFVGVDNFQIHGSPFSLIISPGQTDAKQAVATGQGLYRVVCGERAVFFIQSRDSYGNHVDRGGDKYSISIKYFFFYFFLIFFFICRGPGIVTVPMIRDDNNGTYVVSWTPNVACHYDISITLNQHPIVGSPFKVTAEPGPTYAPACIAEGNGLTSASVSTFGGFKITAHDSLNNKKNKGGDNFVAYIRGKSSLFAAHVIDSHNGTYSVAYLVQEQGQFKLEITLEGIHINKSPFDITVQGKTNTINRSPTIRRRKISSNRTHVLPISR